MTDKSEFRQLTRALGLRQGGLVLVLTAYFDDAGTHKDAEVVVWGGFLGTDEQWGDLDIAWRARLATPFDKPEHAKPALPKFHLAECQARNGLFRDYKRPEADAIQHDFRQIIVDSGVVGISYCIDRLAYDRLVTGEAREFLGTAEQACFGACYKGAFQQAQKHFPQESEFAVVFDFVSDESRFADLRSIGERVEQEDDARPRLVGAGFAKVIHTTPLQAADIIATENYWDAKAFLRDHERVSRAHFRHFLHRVHATGYIMREAEIKHYMWKYGFLDGPEPEVGRFNPAK